MLMQINVLNVRSFNVLYLNVTALDSNNKDSVCKMYVESAALHNITKTVNGSYAQ